MTVMQYAESYQGYRLLQNSCCSNESIALQKNDKSSICLLKVTTNKQHLTPQFISRRSTIQETSLTQDANSEAIVKKIQNMFPTASENHIRLLLKKYYNSEAVVISALQVQKHPLTMPGPFATPPAKRNLLQNTPTSSLKGCHYVTCGNLNDRELLSLSYNNSRSVSPAQYYNIHNETSIGHHDGNQVPFVSIIQGTTSKLMEDIRSKSKVNSSPKMKLRYMKAIFPEAEETFIFDILANGNNNVQIATEKLLSLGYAKRDAMSHKGASKQRQSESQNKEQTDKSLERTSNFEIHSKIYTQEEKDLSKQKLSLKYPNIADHILIMALESVNYDEGRAKNILQMVEKDETGISNSHNVKSKESDHNHIEMKNEKLLNDDKIHGIQATFTHERKTNKLHVNDNNVLHYSFESPTFLTPVSSSLLSSSSPFKSTIGLLDSMRKSESSINSYLRSFNSTNLSTSFWKILATNARVKLPSLKNSQKHINDLSGKGNKSQMSVKFSTYGYNKSPLAKGPNENLLLADYITWNGANPDNHKGQTCPVVGANAALRTEKTYKARGHNPKLYNGPREPLIKSRTSH